MTTTEWIAVAAAIAGGLVVGMIGSRFLTSMIDRPTRPDPIRRAAPALASLVFSICVVIGLIVALGIVSPSSLEQMPKDIVDYIPRVLSAAIIVIAANVLSAFAQAALAPALGRLGPTVQRQTLSAVRLTIITLAVLLAVRQLGFDTTVINLGVAAIFFGVAGALMLLVALGGRRVASEVASTRILRKLFREGDTIQIDTIRGTVGGGASHRRGARHDRRPAGSGPVISVRRRHDHDRTPTTRPNPQPVGAEPIGERPE